jgi:hypothetical protein
MIYQRCCVPRLFRYADQGHWDKIPHRASMAPREAKFVHRYAPAETALHRVVRSLRVISCQEVTNAFANGQNNQTPPQTDSNEDSREPETAEETVTENEEFGNLMLAAIGSILKAYPAAASIPNMFGRTAMHLVCMDLSPARKEAALLLLEHSPQTVKEIDHFGRTPLHYVLDQQQNSITSNLSLELVRSILLHDPKALQQCDTSKETPYDLLLKQDLSGCSTALQQLLDEHREE